MSVQPTPDQDEPTARSPATTMGRSLATWVLVGMLPTIVHFGLLTLDESVESSDLHRATEPYTIFMPLFALGYLMTVVLTRPAIRLRSGKKLNRLGYLLAFMALNSLCWIGGCMVAFKFG